MSTIMENQEIGSTRLRLEIRSKRILLGKCLLKHGKIGWEAVPHLIRDLSGHVLVDFFNHSLNSLTIGQLNPMSSLEIVNLVQPMILAFSC